MCALLSCYSAVDDAMQEHLRKGSASIAKAEFITQQLTRTIMESAYNNGRYRWYQDSLTILSPFFFFLKKIMTKEFFQMRQ